MNLIFERLKKVDGRLIAVLLTLAAGIRLLPAALHRLHDLQAGFCPKGTLLWGATSFTTQLEIAGFVAPLMWALALATTRYRQEHGRRAFGLDAVLAERAVLWAALPLLVVWGLLFFNAIYGGYCVTAQDITYRDGLSSLLEDYRWASVTEVLASCGLDSKGHTTTDLTLVMRNGRKVDISHSMVPLADVARVARSGLSGVAYRLDETGVSAECPSTLRQTLDLTPSAG